MLRARSLSRAPAPSLVRRALCTAPSGTAVSHQPPLAIRTSLVGGATALATPLFPIIGLNQLVFRYLPPQTRMAITGGTSFAYFSAMTLVPNIFYYAPLLVPFAIGNGVTAAASYIALEAAAGGPDKLKDWNIKLGSGGVAIPVAGPAIGMATALAAPLTYPLTFALAWSPASPTVTAEAEAAAAQAQAWAWAYDPAVYEMVRELAYNQVMVPCLLTTGFASGLLLHVPLQPLVVGVDGVAWPQLAGGVLAAVALGLLVTYSAAGRVEIPHLADLDVASLPERRNGRLFEALFGPEPLPCFIGSEAELLWVPALERAGGGGGSGGDGATAPAVRVVSQRLQPTRLTGVVGGGRGEEACYDFGPAAPRESVAGGGRAAAAAALRAKVADKRVRVYGSKHAAFFDGLWVARPLERRKMAPLLAALPVGEALLTDATALLVAGVGAADVERALGECLPLLASSELAARRRRAGGGSLHLHASWADEAARGAARRGAAVEALPEALPEALRRELGLRRAQLAELWRLEHGAPPGPYAAAQLEEQLGAAGVDVARARRSLARLLEVPAVAPPPPSPSSSLSLPSSSSSSSSSSLSELHARADDWRAMERAARREWRKGAYDVALKTVVLGAVLAGLVVWGRQRDASQD